MCSVAERFIAGSSAAAKINRVTYLNLVAVGAGDLKIAA